MSRSIKNIIGFLFVVGFIFLSIDGIAQSKNDLKKKKEKLQKEIALTNKLLKETQKDKKNSLHYLSTLSGKINSRARLIAVVSSEIKLIIKEVNSTKQNISSLENELKVLKEEYAKMIYYAYKNRSSYDKIMFVFASDDFNQAYKRLKYIQQYSEYRKKQAILIIKTQTDLTQKIAELKQQKQEKIALLSLEEQEKKHLSVEKIEQEGIVKKLQEDEESLKKKLKKKQEAAKKLEKAIQKIIEEEIRKARKAAKEKGVDPTKKGFPLTPEALKLSNSFANNKGTLPWPILSGTIVERFGSHPHPVLKSITVNNSGIDIATTKGAVARAVFEGTVSSVAIIPGEGKVVMVRHGEYLTVYSYLSNVFVKKGDKVTTKQHLGALISEPGKSTSNIHLEIWKGMTKLNPEYWIYRK